MFDHVTVSKKMILEREIKDGKPNVFHLDDNMVTSRGKRTSLIVMYSFDIYFITRDSRSKMARHKIFTRLRTCKNSPIAVQTKSMINKLRIQTRTHLTPGFLT